MSQGESDSLVNFMEALSAPTLKAFAASHLWWFDDYLLPKGTDPNAVAHLERRYESSREYLVAGQPSWADMVKRGGRIRVWYEGFSRTLRQRPRNDSEKRMIVPRSKLETVRTSKRNADTLSPQSGRPAGAHARDRDFRSMTWRASMLTAVVLCSLGGACISCARPVALSGRDPASSPTGNWKTCGVARTLARQFTRAFALLDEIPSYAESDRIVFHVCQGDDPDCNQASQPFPGACADRVFVHRLGRQIETSWSTAVTPPERSASYVPVFIESRARDIIVHVDLHYRFAGSPAVPPGSAAHVVSGVTSSRGDAPTIRVVIPGGADSQTRDSAILIGEREIGP